MSGGEDLIVGLVALGLVPWIAWTVRRGMESGRLPIGRGYVDRGERPGAFSILLFAYIAAGLFMALVALDLIFHLGLGFAS